MNDLLSCPATATDVGEAIKHLEDHIVRRMRGRTYDLTLEMTDGHWVLRGRVQTYHAKQLILHTVRSITQMPVEALELVVCQKEAESWWPCASCPDFEDNACHAAAMA
jgi:hypothetical protein